MYVSVNTLLACKGRTVPLFFDLAVPPESAVSPPHCSLISPRLLVYLIGGQQQQQQQLVAGGRRAATQAMMLLFRHT